MSDTAKYVHLHGYLTVGDFFNTAYDREVAELAVLARQLPAETENFNNLSDLFDNNAIMQIFTLAMVLRHGEGDPVMDHERIWLGAELLSQYLIIEDIVRNSKEIKKEAVANARKKYTIIDYVSTQD